MIFLIILISLTSFAIGYMVGEQRAFSHKAEVNHHNHIVDPSGDDLIEPNNKEQ